MIDVNGPEAETSTKVPAAWGWRAAARSFAPGGRGASYTTVVAGLVLGALAGDRDVRSALWPVNWSTEKPFSFEALILAISSVALLALAEMERRERKRKEQRDAGEVAAERESRERAEARRERAEQELLARQDKLEEQARTMPGPDFQSGFDEAARTTHRASTLIILRKRRERNLADTENHIRFVLFTAANLVKKFEKSPHALYSANVIFFHPAPSLTPKAKAGLDKWYKFGGGVELGQLRGVLELQCDLSATTEDPHSVVQDRALEGLVLPVPTEAAEAAGLLPLPGAPSALCNNQMDLCDDVFAISQRALSEGRVLPHVAKEMDAFWNAPQSKHIRSFMSLPLLRSSDPKRPRGVININCSITGMLRSESQQRLLLPDLRAILWCLPEMLDEYCALCRPRRQWDRLPS